uniref:Uncharacterized protein n=1 Tax=Anguilla anguilla TaxID=7936 RepID=A0A0E9XYF2_ANGAN
MKLCYFSSSLLQSLCCDWL